MAVAFHAGNLAAVARAIRETHPQASIVVCADDVRLRQLEIGRGIMPFGGATLRAVTSLGWGNAMRFLLTAEEYDRLAGEE